MEIEDSSKQIDEVKDIVKRIEPDVNVVVIDSKIVNQKVKMKKLKRKIIKKRLLD